MPPGPALVTAAPSHWSERISSLLGGWEEPGTMSWMGEQSPAAWVRGHCHTLPALQHIPVKEIQRQASVKVILPADR